MPLAFSSIPYPTRDWLIDVADGVVASARIIVLSGWSDNVAATFGILWNSTNTDDIESLTAGGSTVKVASTSANDTNSAGSGARTVRLEGINSLGAIVSENLNLGGTSEVTSANTYYHVFRLTVLTAGATGSNEGDLWVGNGTFTVGVPATKYAMMPIGYNVSHTPSYMVPTGRNFLALGRTYSTPETANSFVFRLRYREAGASTVANYPLIDHVAQNSHLDSRSMFFPLISNLDLVVLEAKGSAGSTDAAGSIWGVEYVSDPSSLGALYT